MPLIPINEKLQTRQAEAEASRKPGQCQALCEDFDRPAYHASMQRIVVPGVKACSRKAKEKVGHLELCACHARLARQGLVDKDGMVADRNVRADHRRFPGKFTKPWFKWFPDADPKKT